MRPNTASLNAAAAQASGNSAQLLFEASLNQYRRLGLAWGQQNYPKITILGKGRVKLVGKATTDYTAFIKTGNLSRAIQFEIKTWQAKEEHTYSFIDGRNGVQRRLQYLMMLDFSPFVPTVYLVLWRHKDWQEWRIYPVLDVPQVDSGLRFVREAGVLVREAWEGWPDWLEVMKGKGIYNAD